VPLTTDGVTHSHHLPPTLQMSDSFDTVGTGSSKQRTNLYEHDSIVDVLKRTSGNLCAAVREFGATPRIIRYKVRHLQIDYKRYRRPGG